MGVDDSIAKLGKAALAVGTVGCIADVVALADSAPALVKLRAHQQQPAPANAPGPPANAAVAPQAPAEGPPARPKAVMTVDGGMVFFTPLLKLDAGALRAFCNGNDLEPDDLSRKLDYAWQAPAKLLARCKAAGDDVRTTVLVESAIKGKRSPKERAHVASKRSAAKGLIMKTMAEPKRGRVASVAEKDLVGGLRGHALITGEARAVCVEAVMRRYHGDDAPAVQVLHDADTGAYPAGEALVLAI